jgi:hypothetical protein
MYTKMAFEKVSFEVAKLFAGIASTEDLLKAMRVYTALVEGCGWSMEEYDEEMLRRIDEEWNDNEL